ncbi:MAG: ribonucleoside-diphosphate reductase alpha chain [Parcubacteria bacterium C7867-003]|nr:MAG: ribonucleoside-diphosphate reductase alpha chain [Parcubacteria bacterium C7867-003]
MNITVTRHDGTREPFNADKINRSIERACYGLSDPVSKVTQIASETQLTLYDGITTDEMDQATINAAIQNIKDDIAYDKIATRLFLKVIYRRIIGDYSHDRETLLKLHKEFFIKYIEKGIALNRLDTRMRDNFDLQRLADAIKLDRDELFEYTGLSTVASLYLLKDEKGNYLETPQMYWMRVAMGLSYNEADPTAWAISFYNKMSKMEYVAGTSTNLGAGTSRPALSNCFLMEMHDDMEHIAKTVADTMLISKATGGIGLSITKLRASGSPLKSNNGASSGPTPFAKIIDTAIRAIMRAGKRRGALCFYMEPWHLDFHEFLDWKHNAGDDHMRMRTANTAAFISDEFMNRVNKGEDWYMFDPAETGDLNELYGQAFSERYRVYVEKAQNGELRAFKKMPATELYRKMLVSLQSTSHPWLVWKDPINVRALNNNTGTIHMSNLCTEICLPQDRDNIAVCNLASLNLAPHIQNKEVNWSKLEETVRLAVRQLDNLIDINQLPIPEAIKSDKENRAVGLGVMGLSDVLEQLGMAYDSTHAWDFTDRIFEFISYMAIDESANLAQARGSYQNFEGSGWSKGLVPIDTLDRLEKERGVPLTVTKESRHKGLDWNILRAKVKKGMRNATLMAVAPNATIGLVAGTVPGIDPRFAQVFSRNTLSGKYLDMNHNLVKDLTNLGIWEKVKGQIIEFQGDISGIEEIPQHIKDVYKTSFTTSPYAFIEVAARAQKWIDQALSRNMYLETRDIDETMKIYTSAWAKGVKSTYYLHMKPRHTAEQSTTDVNKAAKIGKVGFGALNFASSPAFSAPLQKSLEIGAVMPESTPQTVSAVASVAVEVKKEVVSNYSPEAPVQEEILVSTSTYSAASNPVQTSSAVLEKVEVKEKVAVVESAKPEQRNEYKPLQAVTTNNPNIIGPEDPADANICISCQ